ncbi:hypothetical protein ACFL0Z_00010 [Patescibacteria group bacterium]
MPILYVNGIPPWLNTQYELEALIDDLQEGVASVKELNLEQDQVTVFLLPDLCCKGLGEEIICMVEGLFNKPERTKDVRNALANTLLAVLMRHFLETNLVEVFVKKFHGDDGYGYASNQEEL